MRKTYTFLRFLPFVLLSCQISAQVYEFPNYSLTSHPTLDILSVERWEDHTVLRLSLKNERYGGEFCIDSSTYLKNSLGEEVYFLKSMEGIPACPETYRFKSVGERIGITLEFGPVPDEVLYIDLIEPCRDNCVSLKYILLDDDLNARLNEGIRLYESGNTEESLRAFEDLMALEYDDYSPVFGTVYLYLIALHYEQGDSKKAREVIRQLRESNIVGREEFISTARDTGIIR